MRRKHLFAGTDGAAALGLCLLFRRNGELNGIEPYGHLQDLLKRMVDGHPIN